MPDETPISCIVGLDKYQEIAFETAMFPPEIGPLYCAMGALGEAGELVEVLITHYKESMEESASTEDMEAIFYALERAVEACKTVEVLKKKARKGHYDLPTLPDLNAAVRARIISEQGDCLWYQAGTAQVSGHKLSDVAQQNIGKLRERRDAGVIASSGETVEQRRATSSD
jgi:hypothetical protein